MSAGYLGILVLIFAGGCGIGRWLHRCVLRFPQHYFMRDQLRSVWTQGDCRSCGTWESGVQQLPVLGWWLAGRCRNCQRKLDARRPLVELLTGLLLAGLYWVEIPDFTFNIQFSGLWNGGRPIGPEVVTHVWTPAVWMHLRYLLHAVLLCGLIVATVIDFELCIIPDGCTVPATLFALLLSFSVGQTWLVPIWFQDESAAQALRGLLPEYWQWLITTWDARSFARDYPHWHGLVVSVAGLVAGAGATWLVRAIGFWTLKQEAMGDGDVVLMALIGAVLGWQPVLVVFMLASALAVLPAIVMSSLRRESDDPYHFPYGPWLSLAAVILLLGWQPIWPRVQAFFDMGLALFMLGIVMFAGLAAMLWSIYLVKRALGIIGPTVSDDMWTSADHVIYYGTERADDGEDLRGIPPWPGNDAGRGFAHYRNWRYPGDR